MAQIGEAKGRFWRWIGWGIGGALLLVLVIDEVRVRWNNHLTEQAWEAEVRQRFVKLAKFPEIDAGAPAVRPYAVGRVLDARSSGSETTFVTTKKIARKSASFRADAKAVVDEYFSSDPWTQTTWSFDWYARAAIVRAKTSDGSGAVRNWFIEFKRLGEKVIFVFLDKGASENSITEPAVALLLPMLSSESDDPGGFNHVQCSLCGGELEVDHVKRWPVLWIAQDRATGKPVPRDTSTKTASSEPVCGKCAAVLPASYVYRMQQ